MISSTHWVRTSTAERIISEVIEISRRTVYVWIDSGRLESMKIPGLGIRISRRSINVLLEELVKENESRMLTHE